MLCFRFDHTAGYVHEIQTVHVSQLKQSRYEVSSRNYYSWIADQPDAHEKLICQRTRRAATILRPPLESSRRGKFRSDWSIFVGGMFSLVLKIKRSKNDHRKIDKSDLNSPRRKLSNGGVKSAVALLVRWQINFSCAFC